MYPFNTRYVADILKIMWWSVILKALLAAQFLFVLMFYAHVQFLFVLMFYVHVKKFGMGQQELNHNAVTLIRLEFTILYLY